MAISEGRQGPIVWLKLNLQKKGLFSEEQSLPQEVSKSTRTKSPFSTRADSKEKPQELLRSNLLRKSIEFSHMHLQKMEPHTKSDSNSSEGESEASLVELLQAITNYEGETAVNGNPSINWSEQDLL